MMRLLSCGKTIIKKRRFNSPVDEIFELDDNVIESGKQHSVERNIDSSVLNHTVVGDTAEVDQHVEDGKYICDENVFDAVSPDEMKPIVLGKQHSDDKLVEIIAPVEEPIESVKQSDYKKWISVMHEYIWLDMLEMEKVNRAVTE